MRSEEENRTEMSEKTRNKYWSSKTQKIKETDCQDNMGLTRRTEKIVNYQERQNITMKNLKINSVTHQTGNTIIIYKTAKEVYIHKQDEIKLRNSRYSFS